jgi:uncharacterized tellurite resistance protein B-like protein
MIITDFSATQRQALLDLLVLAMYVDGHLTLAEDARLKRLLTAMGCETDYDRNRLADAAVTRVRQHSLTAQAAREHALELSRHFIITEHRRQVCDWLDDLLASDGRVDPQEGQFISVIKELFKL